MAYIIARDKFTAIGYGNMCRFYNLTITIKAHSKQNHLSETIRKAAPNYHTRRITAP